MKKILLVIFLLTGIVFAEINEYLSDVYFANGIDTDERTAQDSIDEISREFKLSYPESYKSIKNWKVSYNHTQGIGIDLYESMLQKIDEDWRIKYALDLSGILKLTYGGIAKMVAKKIAKEAVEELTRNEAPASLCSIGI